VPWVRSHRRTLAYVAFAPGWDRLHPLILRFADARLERDYHAGVLDTRRRRQRAATRGGTVIFASLAVLMPPLTGLPVWPLTANLLTYGPYVEP
jgi:hypothetical protein